MFAIRTAGPDDGRRVLSLWLAAEAESTITDDEAALEGLIDHSPGGLLLAEDGAQLVGALIVGWDGWRGSFYRLAVRPERRREGIARALVAEGEARLARLGARRLAVFAVASSPLAVPFWQSVGYSAQDDRQRLVKNL